MRKNFASSPMSRAIDFLSCALSQCGIKSVSFDPSDGSINSASNAPSRKFFCAALVFCGLACFFCRKPRSFQPIPVLFRDRSPDRRACWRGRAQAHQVSAIALCPGGQARWNRTVRVYRHRPVIRNLRPPRRGSNHRTPDHHHQSDIEDSVSDTADYTTILARAPGSTRLLDTHARGFRMAASRTPCAVCPMAATA